MQEPEEIKIGQSFYHPRFTGSKRELAPKCDTYQYVPLLSSLRSLLSDSSVIEEIDKFPQRVRTDDKLEDFCDGQLFKTHPLFSADPMALQIIAFYDEVELCNPLGTHVKKHKLGILLFTLGNIHPKYRSSLRTIQLVIAATYPVILNHGLDAILKPFIEDLKVLANDGIVVTVGGEDRTFRGGLLVFLADNLASHALGGFKENFSFSMRICRTCMITSNCYKCQYDLSSVVLRSTGSHETQCSHLNGPLRDHYSKTYGINRRSSLLDIPLYSMFGGGLPHDIMHDVLEGVLVREMTLLLRYCLGRKFITLADFNERLINFDYDYTESSKPSPILRSFLDNTKKELKLSASQSLLLCRIYPFLIADRIPEGDSHWSVYLLLRHIVDIIMCPEISTDLCAYLKVLILDHHAAFIKCYSEEKVIPKFHFLLHYPEQVQRIGPMIRSWNMRNEAKLNIFKRASRLGNFKNIAFSLAQRHQRLQCWELASDSLLKSPIECGPTKQPASTCTMNAQPVNIREALQSLLGHTCSITVSGDTQVLQPDWVKTDGILIKPGAHFVISSDGLHPLFGRVINVLIILDNVILEVCHMKVDYFDDHYHAYVVSHTSNKSFVSFHELKYPFVLHSHKRNDIIFIYLNYYFQD